MKTKLIITAIALAASLTAHATDFSKVEKSMTWTPVHSITNSYGSVRQGRTAPASQEFWKEWRTNKIEMKNAGFSARPTTNGWEAIAYVKGAKQ
jgi:hypothetical protein